MDEKLYKDIELIIDEAISDKDSIDINADELNLSSFDKNDELSPVLFDDNGEMHEDASDKCISISFDAVDDALDRTDIVSDIILVGSMASYHYSTYSDIDVHIVIDYNKMCDDASEYDEKKQYLKDYKQQWMLSHNELIDDYQIEIYFQDVDDDIVSNGIYSILNGKWIKKPNKDEDYIFDKSKVADAVFKYVDDIDNITNSEDAKKLLDELLEIRNNALQSPAGEMSEYNIVYKVLRRTDYINKLRDMITEKISESANMETTNTNIEALQTHANNFMKLMSIENLGALKQNIQQAMDIWNDMSTLWVNDDTAIFDMDFVGSIYANIAKIAKENDIEKINELRKDIVASLAFTDIFATAYGINYDDMDLEIKSIFDIIDEIDRRKQSAAQPQKPVSKQNQIEKEIDDMIGYEATNESLKSTALSTAASAIILSSSVGALKHIDNVADIEKDMDKFADVTNVDTTNNNAKTYDATADFQKQQSYAHTNENGTASDMCIEMIKHHEKFVSTPYFPTKYEENKYLKYNKTGDNVGKTIGYGHKIKDDDPDWLKNTKRITHDEAIKIFLEDIKNAERHTRRTFAMLPPQINDYKMWPQGFFDAAVSITFNAGQGNFRKSDLFGIMKRCRPDGNGGINEKDYMYTISFIPSTLITQNDEPVQGLIKRRKIEYRMALDIQKQ